MNSKLAGYLSVRFRFFSQAKERRNCQKIKYKRKHYCWVFCSFFCFVFALHLRCYAVV